MDRTQITIRKTIAISFGINFLLAFIAIIPFVIKEQGAFSLGTDYDAIFMPIYNSCRESILNGEVFWNWRFDLGTDFIGSNSFFALGSPFFWITFLFPKVDYLYIGGWMFILKYAVTGMTSGLYMQRFVEKKQYVIIGSILYAFSGFQCANLMMGGFHDVVALFPLMLYGVEVLVMDRKRGQFALIVCINALVNYYFFVGEVIFLVIYFVLRFGDEGWEKIKKVFNCIFEGVVGILMAGILFYPAVVFILQNPRSNKSLAVSEWFLTDRREMLKLFRSFLFPGEMMQQWSCVREYDWSSCSAYLPMIGLVLVLCYILKSIKKKDWLKRILILSIIFMLVPVLGSIFTLMTDVYCRWYYMPLLLFALASAKVMENDSQSVIVKVGLLITLIMVFSIVGFEWWNKNYFQLIYVRNAYIVMNVIGVLGAALTCIIPILFRKKKGRYIAWLVMICIFSVFTTAFTCKRYQDVRGYEGSEYQKKLATIREFGELIETNTSPYRLYNLDNIMASILNMSQSGSSYSNVQGTIFELWDTLGEKRRVVCPDIPNGYYDLVGAKYRISSQPLDEEGWELLGKKESDDGSIFFYEKEDVRSIGVTYSTYMLSDDFLKSPKENRAEIMQSAIIVDPAEEKRVVDVLKKYDETAGLGQQHNIFNFIRDKKEFTCSVESDNDRFLVFSVPYAKGWTAYVNGNKEEILNTNGFMAVKVHEGINNVRMTYFNSDLLVGGGMTIVGILLWVTILFAGTGKNRKCVHINNRTN